MIFSDSAEYLQQLIITHQTVDVVYLDPRCFRSGIKISKPLKNRHKVKKQMQLLHMLLPEDGEMDLGDHLLVLARQIAKRVVVKRPRLAVFLNDQATDHQWQGDACRFDAYFNSNLIE